MTAPLNENQKIQSLEGLRGVMALWVILGHVSQTFGWRAPLVERNTLAVDVFILLSGFVIARLIDRRGELYGPYITRRALRLFPLYLVVLAASALLLPVQLRAWSGIPTPTPVDGIRVWLAQQALARLPAHLLAHLPLAQGLVPDALLPGASDTILGQAWSISLEWQFYLMAPLLMWSLTRRRRAPLVVLIVIILCLAARWFPDGFLGAKIVQFMIGIGSYLALTRPAARKLWLPALALLAIGAMVMSGVSQIVPLVIWTLVLLASNVRPAHPLNALARALGSRPAVHLGEMAYSLYLVHMIPLYLSLYALQALGVRGVGMQAAAAVATLAGAYLIGRVTFVLVEKPGIALGARLTRRAG